jgi:alginate O-acetyltransferase complex protein AlgJ
MKLLSRAALYVSIALVCLVPVANLTAPNWETPSLFSANSLKALFGFSLSQVGISINPQQVIVGKNGWLYLGEQFELSVSRNRQGSAENGQRFGREISKNISSWGSFLEDQSDIRFHVLLGPNKSSVYPENLPLWARGGSGSESSGTADVLTRNPYVTFPLQKLKNQPTPTYSKTDTHWNSLGGYIAYRDYVESLVESGLKVQEMNFSVKDFKKRVVPGGDLSAFLWSRKLFSDVDFALPHPLNVNVKESNSKTKALVYSGPVRPSEIGELTYWKHTETKDALNPKRLMWVRDSFGTAMSPFLYGTFDEVLEVSFSQTNGAEFQQQIAVWKPDLVLVTMAERSVISGYFATHSVPESIR